MTYRPTPITVYNRYDQERFIRQEKEAAGFKINTMGTYQRMSMKSVIEGDQPKKIPALQTPHPEPTLTALAGLQLYFPPSRPFRTPIIIIPEVNTSLITMYNVKDILQDYKFVTTEEKKRQGVKKQNEILLIRRRKNGASTIPYTVMDNTQKLAPGDWDRVVAVFVLGSKWQFRGWPWNANPVDIFSKICGFHVKYEEMDLHKRVAGWDVTLLQFSTRKRHLDRAAVTQFWEKMDK
ncbi:parafibromin-like [Homalodisca vitripennis]|uniref:parafibromin-like n=1 Tax=Homalodisca vitripennis TaxID=197043 RepID=UPI001EEB52F4|nr:parafibromin-like [Homalodisca vitripennis]